MTDDEHDDPGTGTTGGWQPTPGGDYDADATAFVKLPEHLTGGDDEIPLAAPGHGYVPPQITVAPLPDGSADPASTGVWPLPGAAGGDGWAPARPEDGYGYETRTGWYQPPQGDAPAEGGDGTDVTGQWSIPVARGDLPEESGEFSASALAEQWGGTPPQTLPGGAPAPWAAAPGAADTGRAWGGAGREDHAAPGQGPAEHRPQGAPEAEEHPLVRPYARLRPDAPERPRPDDGARQGPAPRNAPGARRPAPYAPRGAARPGPYPPPDTRAPGERAHQGPGYPPAPAEHAETPYDTGESSPYDTGEQSPYDTGEQSPYDSGEQPLYGGGRAPAPGGEAYGTGVRPEPRPAPGPYAHEPYPRRERAPHPGGPGAFEPQIPGARAPHPREHAEQFAPPQQPPAVEEFAGTRDPELEPFDAPEDPAAEGAPDDTGQDDAAPEDPADSGPETVERDAADAPRDGADADAPEAPRAPEAHALADPSVTPEDDATAPLPYDEHPLHSYVLRVNGTDRPVTGAWIGESLLYVLRERLGLAGAKDGCSQGECGACNVKVDGRLVASCLVPAATAAGSEVRTVEGLAAAGTPSDVQRALAGCGAVQCGFCVPGMAMTVHDLLEGNPDPTDLEARQALSGNLCRCSGYRGVLDAVREVVAGRQGSGDPEPGYGPDGGEGADGADGEGRSARPRPRPRPSRPGGTDPAHTAFGTPQDTARHEDDGGRA
ncbi:2Fe-2S iron-sulfur cluster-binding protein [Streptomyces sp. NPDC050560]|uniref:2Fe-2S iron-sulfur cluster-binding protein n=1 Tax=Streptomyces sp. NPDC050560 TaxID=3365630 RepID=UPI00378C82EB